MANNKKNNPQKVKSNTNLSNSQGPLLSQKFLDADLNLIFDTFVDLFNHPSNNEAFQDQVDTYVLKDMGEKTVYNNRINSSFDNIDLSFLNEKFMVEVNHNLNNQQQPNRSTENQTNQFNGYSGSIKLSNVSSYSQTPSYMHDFYEAIIATEPLDDEFAGTLEAFQRDFYILHEISKYQHDIVELALYLRMYFVTPRGNLFYSIFTNMITHMINKGMSSFEILVNITSILVLPPGLKKELSDTYKDLANVPDDLGLRIYLEKSNASPEFNADEFHPANNKCFLLTLIDLTPILYEPHGINLLCYYPEYSLIMSSQEWAYDQVTEFALKKLGIPKYEPIFEFSEAQYAKFSSRTKEGNNEYSTKKEVVNNDENKVIATIGGKKISQKTLDSRALTLKNTYKELSKEEREKLLNITREDVFKVFSRSEIKGQINSSEMSGFHTFAKKATEKIGDDYNVDACDCCSGGKHFDYEVNGRKIYEALFKSEKMKDEDLTDAEFNLRILNDETFIMKKQKTEENKRKGIVEEMSDNATLPSYNSSAKSSILSDIFINSYTNEEDATKVEPETVSDVVPTVPTLASPVFKEEQYKKLAATERITDWVTENILIKNFLKRTFRLLPMVEIAENILSSSLYEGEENNSKFLFSFDYGNSKPSIFSQDGQPHSEDLLQLRNSEHESRDVFKRSKKIPMNNEFSLETFYESLKNNISLEKFDDLLDKTYVDDSDRILEMDNTDDELKYEVEQNVGYTNLKKISEIVWDDNSSTLYDPNAYLEAQFVSLSTKSNDVQIDFTSFNKHVNEFKDYLDEENKDEYDQDIVELKEFTEEDIGHIQGKVDVDNMFNLAKQMYFKDKVVTIDYESFINDLLEDDLNELVIPEEEKKLPTTSLTSPCNETTSTMLSDLYLSKGFDENAKFDLKAGYSSSLFTSDFTFTNSYNGKRLFYHKLSQSAATYGLMASRTTSGLITDEAFERLHKNRHLAVRGLAGTLNPDFLYTHNTKKLQLAKERSYENCDFLDSDDESSDLVKAYDEYETKEKIFNNCITMIRSAVKIALREKLEHATKEIEVEKNRLLLLKQLEEEENKENQNKSKKGKKKEKNKKKQQQKQEKEAQKLAEEKKKEEEERLKNEREEKEMKRREEQRKKAEELKKKKDEQLRKKREEQAKRDEIEANARKQKEEQKRLKEEQRKLKEEEKKKKQLEKKQKQEMKEVEEEMKKKLEISCEAKVSPPKEHEDLHDSTKVGSDQGERRKSLLNTQNVQPYMSLLDSLQGNNSESTTTSLLNMTSNPVDTRDERMIQNSVSYNSSYMLNQPPPGLGMNDFSTPSPMMNTVGYANAPISTPSSMMYNQTSTANANILGGMYGGAYNQQQYANNYGMYGNGMMQHGMSTPASSGTMMNEGEGMSENNYANYNQTTSASVWDNNVPQQGPISSTMMSLAGGGFLNNNMNSYYNSLMGVYGNNNKPPQGNENQQ